MGGTPDLVCGVWTGAEDRSVHFYSTADGQGANMALPVWGLFMKKVYDDQSIDIRRGEFDAPSVPLSIELNCNEYAQDLLMEETDIYDIDFDN
jgi:penicillin-binding protein 1A